MHLLAVNGKYVYMHVLDALDPTRPIYDSVATPAVMGSEINVDASGKATIFAIGLKKYLQIANMFVYYNFQDIELDASDPTLDTTPQGITGLFLPLNNESTAISSTCSPPPAPPALPPPLPP